MNDINLTNHIIAVVALVDCRDMIDGGGAPVFFVNKKEELEETSMLIARVTLGMVHEIHTDIKIIVQH